jgi:hypothetical protein
VPHLVAAFEHAAATHERAAAAHERAAVLFTEHGKLDQAAELESARNDHEGAAKDRERARERRELLARNHPSLRGRPAAP